MHGLTAIPSAREIVVNKNGHEAGYYLNKDNPFAAIFTIDKDTQTEKAWVTHLKGTAAFSSVRCIKGVVQHITTKSRDFYNGTKHEKD